MSIEVTERKMDSKRRVTIPGAVGLKAGSMVVIISSTDSAIIASDTEIAENLAKLLREIEAKRKQKTLSDWERLITSAGLLYVSSADIDRAVARKTSRQDDVDAGRVTHRR